MEVRGPLRHPDQERVRALVQEILSDSRRRVAEWHVEMLEFEFYSSAYQLRLSLDGNSAVAKIPSEWIDQIYSGDSHYRRKIKHAIRDAVDAFYKMEE